MSTEVVELPAMQGAEARLAAAQSALQATDQALFFKQRELNRVRAQLEQPAGLPYAELEQLRRQAATLEAEVHDQRRTRDEAGRSVGAAQSARDGLKIEVFELRARLEEAGRELSKARAQAARLRAEYEFAAGLAESLVANRAQYQARLQEIGCGANDTF
jgi:chromosome segregation ATPase